MTVASVQQQAAQFNRQNALDRLRGALGGAFNGATVTTEYGAPGALNGLPHTGIDLAAAEGTPIQEPVGGTIAGVFHDNVGGNQVEVRTAQGFSEVFAHLAAIQPGLQQGAQVKPGDVLGFVGQTGMATGPHLHYEVQRPAGNIGSFATSVDPLSFISEFGSGISPAGPPQTGGPVGPVGPVGPGTSQSGACAGVPQSLIDSVKSAIGPIGVLGAIFDQNAAATLRSQFPSVPLACLRQIAYGSAAEVSKPTGIESLAANVGQLTGDLTNPQNWAKLGLSFAGVGLIIAGIVLYAGSSMPKPRIA